MPKLRKKAPYTCRMQIAGKFCADYLTDEDGNYCAKCQKAIDDFASQKKAGEPEVERWAGGRIWP
jgi:hypothetical protein